MCRDRAMYFPIADMPSSHFFSRQVDPQLVTQDAVVVHLDPSAAASSVKLWPLVAANAVEADPMETSSKVFRANPYGFRCYWGW